MRKRKRSAKKAIRTILIITAVITLFISWAPLLSQQFYLWTAVIAFIGLCLWATSNSKQSERRIDNSGYVFLVKENDLEHRYIAKQTLGRHLNRNEVVHHINGQRTDNKIRNLCVMDRDKHELFHAWLKWKKGKTKKYPTFKEQKNILLNEYGGILLEYINPPPINSTISSEQLESPKRVQDETLKKHLLIALKQERKRLAKEKHVPAYMIFPDKTLIEISEIMPECESDMLKIHGVGTIKIRLYGPVIISIVKRFKNHSPTDPSNKKNSA